MLETLEGTINQEINLKVSKTLISSEQQEYLNELLPSKCDWNILTSSDKIALGDAIVTRLNEIVSLNSTPTIAIEDCVPNDFKPLLTEYNQLKVLDNPNIVDRGILAVEEYFVKYGDWGSTDIEQRANSMSEFFNDLKGYVGVDANLRFEDIDNFYGLEKDGTIIVNKNLLLKETLVDAIKTILHEYRHVIQEEACCRTDYLGFSENTIQKWQTNLDNYISSDLDYEGYVKQPIENDAFTFEKYIYQQGKKILSRV